VAAGAIEKLLTLIRSASRSIPDQQVSKHALSTLGHLARYPQMADELINTKGSIQTIFWELLRSSFSSQVFFLSFKFHNFSFLRCFSRFQEQRRSIFHCIRCSEENMQ